jgi:hypothetical protein
VRLLAFIKGKAPGADESVELRLVKFERLSVEAPESQQQR